MIDSECLRTFAAFADDANMSRAAKRLHLSQPAVHAQIARLAETVGLPLYRRVGRGLELTREGIEVAAFARDSAERSHDLLGRLHGEKQDRHLVLAAGAGAIVHLLSPGLRSFARRFEGRLDVVATDAVGAMDAVSRGTAHVGVGAVDVLPSELHGALLATVPQVVVLPRGHALAKRPRVSLSDLAGERFVLPPPGRPQRIAIDAAFAGHNVTISVGAIATGWEVLVRLADLGVGLAIVNATVQLPASLVGRRLHQLPQVRYQIFTRPRPRSDAEDLVAALREHLSARGKRSPIVLGTTLGPLRQRRTRTDRDRARERREA